MVLFVYLIFMCIFGCIGSLTFIHLCGFGYFFAFLPLSNARGGFQVIGSGNPNSNFISPHSGLGVKIEHVQIVVSARSFRTNGAWGRTPTLSVWRSLSGPSSSIHKIATGEIHWIPMSFILADLLI